jgi:ABC-type iron transport system FetAB permease component
MILGNAISAIGVGINTISREFAENKDKVETYLAMGASRSEAVKPVAVEALKLALLPTVNQMSVIGLISIPGKLDVMRARLALATTPDDVVRAARVA